MDIESFRGAAEWAVENRGLLFYGLGLIVLAKGLWPKRKEPDNFTAESSLRRLNRLGLMARLAGLNARASNDLQEFEGQDERD